MSILITPPRVRGALLASAGISILKEQASAQYNRLALLVCMHHEVVQNIPAQSAADRPRFNRPIED